MSKLPKRIQEIIDNRGKTAEKVRKEIEQARIDISEENRRDHERLKRALGC